MNNYDEVIKNYKSWHIDLQDKEEFEKRRQSFIQHQLKLGATRVQIEPTQRCNYKCHMCPIDEFNSNDVKKDLSLEEFRIIVDKLPKSISNICLSGLGEPFLNKDYVNMVKYAHDKGFITEVYNNGSLFDEDVLKYVNYLFFSVDGLTESLLKELRAGVKYDKLFDAIKKSIQYKTKRDLNICINFTISKQNYQEIPLLFKVCDELGVDYVHIQPMANNYSVGSEKSKSFSTYIKEHQFNDWKYIVDNFSKEFEFNLTVWYPRPSKGFCNWSFSSIYINKNMDVISCCQRVTNPLIFGNLKESSFQKIYNDEPMVLFREKHLYNENIPLCNNCPY